MSEVFLDILNSSIAASWVVLAVILARFLLRKAPKSITCALWWIVGFRLLYHDMPEAPFSLIPSAQTITPESMYDNAPVISSGVELIDAVVNPVYTESFRTEGLASVNPLQVWTAISANLWLLGMLLIWAWAIISWFRVRRRVAASVKLRDNIFLCDNIDTPFILGAFSPKIYLPSALDECQRSHVIAHEEAHIRRRDYYYKPWAYFLLSVNWFNPVIWLAYILLCRDIELACDEQVIKSMTPEEKKGYSTALLECSIHRHMIAACPLAFGEVGVKERIKAVLSYKKPAFWIVLIAAVVGLVLALGFLTDPVAKISELRYNGALYVRYHNSASFLPVEDESIGTLRSILHNTTEHPDEEFQATNLDESLAGCPLYLEGDCIYLQRMDGTCMAFRAMDPSSTVRNYATPLSTFRWRVYNGNVTEFEEIPYELERSDYYSGLLESLRDTEFIPGAASGNVVAELSTDNSGREEQGITLRLYDSGIWELTVHKESFGNSRYTFSSQTLDDWAQPLIARSGNFASILAEPTQVVYYAYIEDSAILRFGLPAGWEFETLGGGDPYDDIIGFRFRPEGMSGDVSMFYYPDGEQIGLTGGIPVGAQETITLSTGLTGTKITPDEAGIWSMIVFSTEQGTLFAAAENVEAWWADHGEVAEAILGSITLHVAMVDILSPPNQLGIELTVENPTPSGLTLVCTQDGAPWDAIFTGSDYNIARWYEEEGEWALLPMREDTAWTMAAYNIPLADTTRTGINWEWIFGKLEPGQYRIYKSYSGKRGMLANREDIYQTFYAEFTIE